MVINTNNSYSLLSTYYVPDSLLSISYAPLRIMSTRPYKANSVSSPLYRGGERGCAKMLSRPGSHSELVAECVPLIPWLSREPPKSLRE